MNDQNDVNLGEALRHKTLAINELIKNLKSANKSISRISLKDQIITIKDQIITSFKRRLKKIYFLNILRMKFKQMWFELKVFNKQVTIVVTTHNQSKELVEVCINSIIYQTFLNFKLIIIDDGSTNEETLKYLTDLNNLTDSRISIIFTQNNGVVKARNLGIKLSRTKYITFVDPDDSLENTFLEKCFLLASTYDKNLALIHPDVAISNHENKIWETEEMSYEKLLLRNSIPISCLINLKILKKVGGFSTEQELGYEDWELWVRIAGRGYHSKRIPEPLFKYSFNEYTGRDSLARVKHSFLSNKIRLKNSTSRAAVSRPISRTMLQGFELKLPYTLNSSDPSPIYIFVPWLTKFGGAEKFLRVLAQGLVDQKRTVIFVSTENIIQTSTRDYLEISPFVYDLPKFLLEGNYIHFVKNLLARSSNPIILNCGSVWLYENLTEITNFKNGVIRNYDILFNQLGHLSNFLSHQHLFRGAIPVYQLLANLLTDDLKVSPEVTRIPVGILPLNSLPLKEVNTKPKIGWLGRLSEEKRPRWFVDLALTAKVEADFKLAGTGILIDKLFDQGRNSTNFEMLGEVENNLDFIASLDLVVSTSFVEGISLTAMEAIQLGVPVVAPRIGGMSELIKNGHNGYLYDVDDFNSLKSIVEFIFESPEVLKNLQKTTKEMGLPKQFEAESMITSYLKLLN